MNKYNYTSTAADSVTAVLHVGIDLNCGTFFKGNAQTLLNNQMTVQA
jgi:hypothetical protein